MLDLTSTKNHELICQILAKYGIDDQRPQVIEALLRLQMTKQIKRAVAGCLAWQILGSIFVLWFVHWADFKIAAEWLRFIFLLVEIQLFGWSTFYLKIKDIEVDEIQLIAYYEKLFGKTKSDRPYN